MNRPPSSTFLVVTFVIYTAFQQKVSMQRIGNADGEPLEYCQWEIFNASCGGGGSSDEVVLMNSARYGRMRFGRCMKEDHGNAGCAAVVLPHLDQICSGRRNCQLNIPDVTLHNTHPCPKELMPYLEASYSCIPVQTGSPQFCALYGCFAVDVQTPVGFLASVTAIETSVGLRQCPWSIEVRKGQKINLTLYSFSAILENPGAAAGGGGRRTTIDCDWTVEIQEGNLTVQVPGCIPTGREKLIYTSQGQGGSLKVHLQTSADRTGVDEGQAVTSNIIIKYQVFGCADILATAGTSVKRHGDTIMVTCLALGQTDALTCFNGQWIGESVNCSKGYAIESGHVDVKNNSFPYGLILVVGVGILMGVILGVIMLFTIIICLRRRREGRLRSQTTDPLLQKPGDSTADLESHSTIYIQRQLANSSGTLCPYHHLRYHENHLRHHLHLHHHHSSGDIIESDGGGNNAGINDVRDRSTTPYPLCVVDAGSECVYERWMTPGLQPPRPPGSEVKRQTSTFINDVTSTSQSPKNDEPQTPQTTSTSLSDGCRSPGSPCSGGPVILDVLRGARTSKLCPHHIQ